MIQSNEVFVIVNAAGEATTGLLRVASFTVSDLLELQFATKARGGRFESRGEMTREEWIAQGNAT